MKMKHIYKYIASVTAAVVASSYCLAAAGCAYENDEQVKSIKIGVTLYDQYDTFISELMNELNDYATKKSDETGVAINIEVMNASGSQSTQDTQVETMIEDECDVICVNLVDRTEPTTIIDLAEKNDVPVIFFNRELVAEDLERWESLYYVGADALVSGILQGDLAAAEFLDNPTADKNGDGIFQYVVLEGEAGHQDAIMRTEYSVSTMIDYGIEVEKLGYGIANWNRAPAQNQMSQMLSSYGDEIELVLANNDDMALGAIDALKSADIPREDWPIVVGIDGTEVGLEAIKNGDMIGTVYNDKEGQADAIVELAYRLAAKQSLDDLDMTDGRYIRLPYTKITPENVDDYM
jgi:methyl-galactoside transport system substrate-binding protein